jgi:predicted metal-dependent phosphoesterase TrpH
MLLDLHVHSTFSLDSPTPPEEYAGRAVALGLQGLVFMEHKRLVTDFDFAGLGQKNRLLILHGVEAETFWGHLLLYGVTPALAQTFDFSRRLDPVPLARAIAAAGGLVVPAHIFRPCISLGVRSLDLPGICAVETLNGANSEDENRFAVQWASQVGLFATGGSDAHFLSELGSCLTRLQNSVQTMAELIAEISAGRCQALRRDHP